MWAAAAPGRARMVLQYILEYGVVPPSQNIERR